MPTLASDLHPINANLCSEQVLVQWLHQWEYLAAVAQEYSY